MIPVAVNEVAKVTVAGMEVTFWTDASKPKSRKLYMRAVSEELGCVVAEGKEARQIYNELKLAGAIQ